MRWINEVNSLDDPEMPLGEVKLSDKKTKAAPPSGLDGVLSRFAESDREAARLLLGAHVRQFSPRRDLICEGERPKAVVAILEGWACCYKTLRDGRRQIVAFLIPGDFCDPDAAALDRMDHSIGAITNVRAAWIGFAEFGRFLAAHEAAAAALRHDAIAAASTQREWTLNVGQRAAYERVAHLICEMFVRQRAAGLVPGGSCEFPITQTDIGDATGLTPVHVNRMIQALRAEGLIVLQDKKLAIPDLRRLMRAATFSDAYLHLARPKGEAEGDD